MKTRESLEERFAVKEKDKTLKESRHDFGGHGHDFGGLLMQLLSKQCYAADNQFSLVIICRFHE